LYVHRHACVACMGQFDLVLSLCSRGTRSQERERKREREREKFIDNQNRCLKVGKYNASCG
jgi:hypothetical protein